MQQKCCKTSKTKTFLTLSRATLAVATMGIAWVASAFAVSATASDGVTEVFESNEYPFVGVQFHSEKLIAAARGLAALPL